MRKKRHALVQKKAVYVKKNDHKTVSKIVTEIAGINFQIATMEAKRQGLLVQEHRQGAARLGEEFELAKNQLDESFRGLARLHASAVSAIAESSSRQPEMAASLTSDAPP